jgi:SAM-dependent MidA family methyltransferase
MQTLNSIGQTRGRVQAVHLVETSAKLREEQRGKLIARVEKDSMHWHDRLEEVLPSGKYMHLAPISQ